MPQWLHSLPTNTLFYISCRYHLITLHGDSVYEKLTKEKGDNLLHKKSLFIT